MPRKKGSGTATTWSAWKRAPASLALFWLGKGLSRLGFGVEKAGGWLVAVAVRRLERIARERAQ